MIGEPRLSRSCTFFSAVPAPGSSISAIIAHRVSNWAGGGRSAVDRCRATRGVWLTGKDPASKKGKSTEPGDSLGTIVRRRERAGKENFCPGKRNTASLALCC